MRVQTIVQCDSRLNARRGTVTKVTDEGETAFVRLDEDGGWRAGREMVFAFSPRELTIIDW